MDLATRFLIDECLSPDLAEIVKREYGMQAIHVPWLGRPPRGKKSWQDPDVVDEVAINDFVLVTNNRRDFVQRYYPAKLTIHNGLVIVIQKSDLDSEKAMFRAAMDVIMQMDDIVNKLIEVDPEANVTVTGWPNPSLSNPWTDPRKG
jgi:hypothetical protein